MKNLLFKYFLNLERESIGTKSTDSLFQSAIAEGKNECLYLTVRHLCSYNLPIDEFLVVFRFGDRVNSKRIEFKISR